MTLRDYASRRGRRTELSRAINVSPATVTRWIAGRVPAERMHAVSRVTGIPVESLRPDLFGSNDAGAKRNKSNHPAARRGAVT